MQRGEDQGTKADAYRQVQFDLDDELIEAGEETGDTAEAHAAELAGTVEAAAPPGSWIADHTGVAPAPPDAVTGEGAAPLMARSVITAERRQDEARRAGRARKAPPKTDRVGVVFVHGVGSQPQSETVREFGQPLIDWLEEWHADRKIAGFKVTWSRLSYGSNYPSPASYALRIPAHGTHKAQTWFMAEAWWASRLAAPSVGTVLGWTLGSYPDLIVTLAKNAARVMSGKHYGAGPRMTLAGRTIASFNTAFVLASYVLALVPGLILLGTLALVAKIPVPGLEQFVLLRLLQPLLVNNLGDFVVFMHDDVQAVHIRQSVYDAISWLVRVKRCARVVVVAHSQGTVVAFDALTASAGGGQSIQQDLQKVRKLVTFGAALNRMWAEADRARRKGRPLLRTFATRLRRNERWTNFYSEFDWAPIGPLKYGNADDEPVTNNLSALSDHGEYFNNHEQFTSRLAQEIDSDADRSQSRFWPAGGAGAYHANRLHREQRVTTWALWRLLAWVSVLGAFIVRYGVLGRDIGSDADALWAFLVAVPVVGGIPSFLAVVGGLVAAAADIVPGVGVLADWIRLGLVPLALTGGGIGAVVVTAYLIAVSVLFVGWHRGASLSTAHVNPQRWDLGSAGVRTLLYAAFVGSIAIVTSSLPPLSDVGSLLTTVGR